MPSPARWLSPIPFATSAAFVISACSLGAVTPDRADADFGHKGQKAVTNPPSVGAAVSGTYRNLFVEWLGVSQAEVDAKIDALWAHYFEGGRE
jgi:hypothetical protein